LVPHHRLNGAEHLLVDRDDTLNGADP